MPNNKIQSLTVEGVTYDIVDNTSGYITADSPALTGTPTAPTPLSGASDTQIATVKYVQDSMAGVGTGTVTSVGVDNATNGGLSVSGSPITGSGTISVGHSNVLTSAQTTSGIYPIKIDKNGHISEYGSAIVPLTAASTLDATKLSGTIPAECYTDTDTKMTQTYAAESGYSYWRPLIIGYSSGSTEGFTPSTVTNTSYTFKSLTVQPSTGTIRVGNVSLYKGNYTVKFTPDTLTANRTITVPDATGTIALTSDIPDVSGKVSKSGDTITGKLILDYNSGNGALTFKYSEDCSATLQSYGYLGDATNNTPILRFFSSKANFSDSSDYYVLLDGVKTPTGSDSSDNYYVANKKYVDDKVGALSIPTKVSDLTNDSGFITGMTILSYGTSTWNDFLTAYSANKVVYCRASSNSNPATGSQTRLAFMAYVNDATSPTSVEFQYYRSVNTHTESQQGDQVYVYTLTSAGSWSVTAREASVKVVAGTGLSGTYSNGTMTLTGPTISLNGSSTTSASFYAPTDAGTSGQVLTSNGSGAPTWATIPAGVTVTLNGSTTTTPSFYAPTTAGTDGYVLKSNGSGAPTWTNAVLTDEKLSVAEVTSGSTYYPIVGSGTSAATRQIDSTGFSYSGTDGTVNNSSNGKALLTLGNSTSYTTAGWKRGQIRLYGCQTGYTTIQAYSWGTGSNTVNLPTSSGTLALTDDILYPEVIWIYGNDDGNGNITYEGPTYSDAMSVILMYNAIRCYYSTVTPNPEDEYSPIYSEDYSIYYLSYYDGNYEDPIVFINTTESNSGGLTYSIITIDTNDNITMSAASGGGGSSTEIIRWTES